MVREYIAGRDTRDIRDMQKRILTDYSLDISKHAKPEILGRIHQVWNSIPQQLAKSNKKFIYGDIQKGARAKDFELAIEWLKDAGIIYKIPRVRKTGIPLKFYENNPDSKPIRISMSPYRKQDWMTNIPLYAACRINY